MEFGKFDTTALVATSIVLAAGLLVNSPPSQASIKTVAAIEAVPGDTPTPTPSDLAPTPTPTPSETAPPIVAPTETPAPTPTPTIAPLPPNPLENGVVFDPTPAHAPDQQYTQHLTIDGLDTDVIVPGDKLIRAEVGMLHQFHLNKLYAEKDTAKFIRLGSAANYLMAYPSSEDGSWKAGLCCGEAANSGRDDPRVINHLMEYLRYKYNIAPEAPTVLGGISNGAMETAEVYCKYPNLLDAAILASGNLQDRNCDISARVPRLWMLRSSIDGTVPVGPTGKLAYRAPLQDVYSGFLGKYIQSDASTINAFMNGNRCTNSVTNRRGIKHQTITCGSRVMHYVTESRGPHGWRDIAGPGTIDTSDRASQFIQTVISEKKVAVAKLAAQFRATAASSLVAQPVKAGF